MEHFPIQPFLQVQIMAVNIHLNGISANATVNAIPSFQLNLPAPISSTSFGKSDETKKL